MSPDLRRKVDANRAQRLANENAMRRQTLAQVRPSYVLRTTLRFSNMPWSIFGPISAIFVSTSSPSFLLVRCKGIQTSVIALTLN